MKMNEMTVGEGKWPCLLTCEGEWHVTTVQ